QIIQREKHRVTVRKVGADPKEGAEIVASLFSLADPLLESLMDLKETDAELREGLGLLLLYRAGPRRAERFLSTSTIPKSRRMAYPSVIESASEIWLLTRFEEVCALFKELSDKGSKVLSQWEDLSSQIMELVKDWRRSPGYPDHRTMLFELFLRGKAEIFK